MNNEQLRKKQEEILRLNKNIKDFSAARDILRAQVRNFCTHDAYSFCRMDPPDASGRFQHWFVCLICGEQHVVKAMKDSLPKERQVSLEEINMIIRDLGLMK